MNITSTEAGEPKTPAVESVLGERENPHYPFAKWREAVNGGWTLEGYRDWVEHEMLKDEPRENPLARR